MSKTEVRVVSKQNESFDIICRATNKLVDTIKPTFGPAGNKVIIDKMTHRMVVDDGVQIARDFELPDPAENAVVKLVREVAIKTNDRIGDGTTGALIMLQGIVNTVARKTKQDGRKIVLELRKGLEDVKKHIAETKKEISTKDELQKVAMVAFDNPEIAQLLADAYDKIGKDGIITIDKSPTMNTILEMADGTQLDTGYISPYMVNNPERMESVIDNPYILLTDFRLTENSDIMPIMEKMAQSSARGLVIIADNVEQSALATLVINEPNVMNPETKRPGTFPSVAVPLPQGNDKKVLLEDLALLTGAKVFSTEKGDKLEDATIEDLGRADRFICRQKESIIVNPKGKKEDIMISADYLRTAAKNEDDETKKKALQRRLAMFTNSLAVIKVGAPTENEQKALRYKIEDAVHAVKAAYQGGVVCGGGLALARINTSSPILNESLKMPARQLCENMGFDNDEEYFAEKDAWNLITGEHGDFMEVGVMDPADVLLAGVESAVSIASVLLTSHGMLVEHTKPENNTH